MHATIPDTNLKMFKLMASMAAVCCVMFIILAITYFNSFSSTNENISQIDSNVNNGSGNVTQTVEEIQKFLYPDNPVNGVAAAVGTAVSTATGNNQVNALEGTTTANTGLKTNKNKSEFAQRQKHESNQKYESSVFDNDDIPRGYYRESRQPEPPHMNRPGWDD